MEVKRQAFHLFFGLSIAGYVYLFKPQFGGIIAVPILLGVIYLLLMPRMRYLSFFLNHFERSTDRVTFPFRGAINFGIGAAIPMIVISDTNIACAIIAVLSTGDAASTVIGKLYGSHRIQNGRSIEGSIAFISAGTIGAYAFTSDAVISFAFAAAGALIEIFTIVFDDNLTIPLGLTLSWMLWGLYHT